MQQLSISNARKQLTTLPPLLKNSNEILKITRNGKPILAIMSWDLYETIIETLEVMADPKALQALKKGVKEYQSGKFKTLEETQHLFEK